MHPINVMVNGIPGNVAGTVARRVRADARFELLPFSLTGPEEPERTTGGFRRPLFSEIEANPAAGDGKTGLGRQEIARGQPLKWRGFRIRGSGNKQMPVPDRSWPQSSLSAPTLRQTGASAYRHAEGWRDLWPLPALIA